jgi:hypothetical protein
MGIRIPKLKTRTFYCERCVYKFRQALDVAPVCPLCRLPVEPFSKMGNRRVEIDGVWYDSDGEARRHGELQIAERGGAIADLRRQVVFPILIPDTTGTLVKVCDYTADFTYTDVETGLLIVEDFKGRRTRDYKLRKKLMWITRGIPIHETEREARQKGRRPRRRRRL